MPSDFFASGKFFGALVGLLPVMDSKRKGLALWVLSAGGTPVPLGFFGFGKIFVESVDFLPLMDSRKIKDWL
ncbi:MAG: hypothetical protein QME75_02075 [Deltaproteobacteria bacterium]|nr:hypothetical protein [Deltaproteobacteria bacterium]